MSLWGRLFIYFFRGDLSLRKPILIFRKGKRTTLKSCVLLLVCALLLALSVELYCSKTEKQGSMEVFAGADREEPRPQGFYALLGQLFGDD